MAIQQTKQALAPTEQPRSGEESASPQSEKQNRRERSQFRAKDTANERLAAGLGWFSIGLGLAEVIAPRSLGKLIGLSEEHPTLMRVMGLREIAAGLGILTNKKPAGWLWARVAGDALDLSLLGAALADEESDKGKVVAAVAAVAGVTALDVLCAQQLTSENASAPEIKSITVGRSPEEVYHFWRDFNNLPRFMAHLESVQVTGEKRSHWVARTLAGTSVEWDAEITEDRPNQLISWRSLPGSDVSHSGTVRFERAPGDRGTEVTVELQYDLPAGGIGAAIAKMFGEAPEQKIKGDLYRFKQVLETGEVVHSDSSIHRGMHPARPEAAAATGGKE